MDRADAVGIEHSLHAHTLGQVKNHKIVKDRFTACDILYKTATSKKEHFSLTHLADNLKDIIAVYGFYTIDILCLTGGLGKNSDIEVRLLATRVFNIAKSNASSPLFAKP